MQGFGGTGVIICIGHWLRASSSAIGLLFIHSFIPVPTGGIFEHSGTENASESSPWSGKQMAYMAVLIDRWRCSWKGVGFRMIRTC